MLNLLGGVNMRGEPLNIHFGGLRLSFDSLGPSLRYWGAMTPTNPYNGEITVQTTNIIREIT